jgi:hypothetical protein
LPATGAFSNPFFSLCFSCLLTGVAALLAQGTCPSLLSPIFGSALLMTYCLTIQLQVSETLRFETENILILGSIYSVVVCGPYDLVQISLLVLDIMF